MGGLVESIAKLALAIVTQGMALKLFPLTAKGSKHLTQADPLLGKWITQVGPMRVEHSATDSVFVSLATSIMYQQLHGKAAATIVRRFKALHGVEDDDAFPCAEHVASTAHEVLRSAGLSRAKALAVQDLAQKIVAGTVPTFEQTLEMSDDALIEVLTQVRGIGPWTVQMFLIFTLKRPDVLPTGDFGVRKGFANVYRNRSMPTPKQLEKYGERWKPYRSLASLYLWRAADTVGREKPKKSRKKS